MLQGHPQYSEFQIKTSLFTTAQSIDINVVVGTDNHLTVNINPIFSTTKYGMDVLNNLIDKTISGNELSDSEAIDLLILPYMNVNLPVKLLFGLIILIIGNANIEDDDFKTRVTECELRFLACSFVSDEYPKMVSLLKAQPGISRVDYSMGEEFIYLERKTENPELNLIMDRFGLFGVPIIFDRSVKCISDVCSWANRNGFLAAKILDAKKLMELGVDEDIIFKITDISVETLKVLN